MKVFGDSNFILCCYSALSVAGRDWHFQVITDLSLAGTFRLPKSKTKVRVSLRELLPWSVAGIILVGLLLPRDTITTLIMQQDRHQVLDSFLRALVTASQIWRPAPEISQISTLSTPVVRYE